MHRCPNCETPGFWGLTDAERERHQKRWDAYLTIWERKKMESLRDKEKEKEKEKERDKDQIDVDVGDRKTMVAYKVISKTVVVRFDLK
ncbi:hypothetical protein HanRHA438_Chr02g0060731 [Helianthus annuus]|nr:hypothetical protein HanRHA438_Chr02g0060731 [Helianthus annuus]